MTTDTIPANESLHVQAYLRLDKERDQVPVDSEEEERILDQMDFHWYRLTAEEENQLRLLLPRRNAMSTVTEAETIHKSKWGYHPCSYQTFCKLKALHKAYWKALHAHMTWVRWRRKDPQNRVIREYLRDDQGRKCGVKNTTPRPEPEVCPIFRVKSGYLGWKFEGHGIVDLYNQARMPQPEPVPAWNTEKIDRIYDELQKLQK